MNRTSDEVPVATAAPLLRLALVSILMVAALAGALVAGPVAVMVDGRARSRAERVAGPRVRAEQPRGLDIEQTPARLAA